MKAFLSHSSRDKPIIEQVAQQLGGANVELDSVTFDRGVLNVVAIQQALRRSSLFVLFLSRDSLASGMVNFEVVSARELQARGLIERTLVVCLDEEAFKAAPEDWKATNVVRAAVSPQSIARLIQNQLIQIRSRDAGKERPFVGRQRELHEAKEKLIDPELPQARAIFVSGNAGIGRRTFARKLYGDVYPAVNPLFPEIHVEKLDGYDELYRKLTEVQSPISTLSSYRARILGFALASEEGKADLIARQINGFLASREALIVHDDGGVLDDAGAFQPAFANIIRKLEAYPHPPLILIAQRMMPHAQRVDVDSILFCPLPSLERKDARQLLGLLLRQEGISFSSSDLETLVDLSDNHPFNVTFIVEAIKQYTLPVFLADTSGLTQWKRRRTSEFLQKIDFSSTERLILGVLKDFRALDFQLLSQIADTGVRPVAEAITRLMDYHVLETVGDTYSIAPPLRIAVERDVRFNLAPPQRRNALDAVASTLNVDAEGEISVSMVNAAILAGLQRDGDVPELFSAFLLPSHYVWLARRRYDEKQYEECTRLVERALEGKARLSPAGKVEACRLLCLAATRLGQDDQFKDGIALLREDERDDFAKSNIEFLLGFNARMRGYLPEAEEHFREAYRLSPGNFSAARELAAICNVRGDVESAEQFARRAFEDAQDNPYILDILLSVLINLPAQRRAAVKEEVDFLFEKLGQVGELAGHSFYTTRRAEYELRNNGLSEACKLIDEAVHKTPWIFEVRALRAKIYLERGNKTIVAEEIRGMQAMVDKNSTGERRTNLRPLLEIRASLLASNHEYEEAKRLYRTPGVFTKAESQEAIRRIEIEQAYARQR